MAKGDHIFVERVGYSHHGIDSGNGRVIHFVGEKISDAAVKVESIRKFANGGKVYRRNSKAKYARDVIVRRAKGSIGKEKYNLVFNNCEHFANWCRTGKHKSEQVEDAVWSVPIYAQIKDFIRKINGYDEVLYDFTADKN